MNKKRLSEHQKVINTKLTKKKWRESMKGSYLIQLHRAKVKKLLFTITLEQYELLRSSDCVYCGLSHSSTRISMDRIDNTKGYVIENILPSCIECNRVRSDKYSVDQMKLIGKVLSRLRQCQK